MINLKQRITIETLHKMIKSLYLLFFILSSKAVLLIEDTDKNDDWIALVDSPDIYYLDSDHNFISQRGAMIDKIITWLK